MKDEFKDLEKEDVTKGKKGKKKPYKKSNKRGSNKRGNATSRTIDNSDIGTHNDVSWYIGHSSLAMDAGSIPYGIPLGRPINRDIVKAQSITAEIDNRMWNIPGIMRITVAPTFGVSTSYSSPINRAAQMVYAFVRHVNAGHANYDPNDLIMYIGAMSSVYSYITWLDRLYGTFQVYAQMNSYMPKDLIEAMCVDFDDLQVHMMDLKYYIDQLTVRASAFCVPGDLAVFKRMAFMYEGIYTDGASSKCGLYFYNPSFFYQYDETETEGGILKVKPFFNEANLADFNDLVAYGNQLLDAVAGSEDVGIMSGDILKAYGQSGLVKLATVPFGYTVVPVFSEEVLEQMHNAKCLPLTPDFTNQVVAGNWNVKQHAGIGGYIDSTPISGIFTSTYLRQWAYSYDKQLISAKSDPVSAETTILNTRLTIHGTYEADGNGNLFYLVSSCGSEIVTAIDVFRHQMSTGTLLRRNLAGTAPAGSFLETMDAAALLIHFKYCPEITLRGNNADAFSLTSVMDVDNYTVVDSEELRNIHESAWLSMLRVPTMGLYENATK